MEYESDALYGINKSLLAYYSYSDMSEIHIYDGTRSLGVARPVATVNPLAAVLGGELDMQQISQKNKEFAKLRRQTRDIAGKIADFGGNALMELPYMQGVAVRRQPLQHITGKQQPSISFAQESPQISAAEAAQLTAIATAARIGSAPSYTVPAFFGSELERYDYLFLLVHEQGVALTQEDAAFMTNYEVSDEFQYTGPRYTQLKAYYARTQQAQGA